MKENKGKIVTQELVESTDAQPSQDIVQDIAAYWTQRAQGYSQTNQEELASAKQAIWRDLILRHAPQKKTLRVLDIGTGPGFFAITLALAGHKITAVDVTQAMLDQAQINAQQYKAQVEWVLSDVQELPFADESFDLIVVRNVTWDLDKPVQAYREWHRVLAQGGRLLNFDANWYLFLYDHDRYLQYLQDRNNTALEGIDDHYVQTDTTEMERIARQLPLSQELRPQWDMRILINIGFNTLYLERDISKIVWDEIEQLNYRSTPMFMIVAEK